MKKALSLLLALALLSTLPTAAFAADERITGFTDNQTLADAFGLTGASRREQTYTYKKTIKPGARSYINLTHKLFEWEDNDSVPLTAEVMRDNNMSVMTIFEKGEDAVEDVYINYHQRQIVIQYAKTLAATEPVEFEFNVHMAVNGRRYRDRGITFVGTIENSVVKVSEGTSIDLAGGGVAEAKMDFAKIKIKLGDATVTTSFTKGERYYANCNTDFSSTDNKLMKQHPEIAKAVNLRLIGINKDTCTVKLQKDYAKYYVYDKDLNYLGRGDEQLAYRNKYYLCKSKLDV